MFRAEMLKNKLQKALELVETSEKITGVQFKDLKGSFNCYMQEVWDDAVTNATCGSEDPVMHELYWVSRPESHTFNSVRKQLGALAKESPSEKAAAIISNGLKALDDNEVLLAKVLAIKPQVGQRGERAPSRTAPVVPAATSNAKETIRSLLAEMAEQHRASLVNSHVEMFNRVLGFYEAMSDEEAAKIWADDHQFMAQTVALFMHKVKGAVKMARHENTAARIQQCAEEQAKNIVDRYVAKMLSKLGALVDLMGAPLRIEHNYSSNAGHLNGWIEVVHADGRAYCAITALEWSHSIYGKPFTRYPCRFKHVRAAGGVMFKHVMSEAQIIEWAKAQAK